MKATQKSNVARVPTKQPLYCSFCGKNQHEVRMLVAGPTVFICDECKELCIWIVAYHCGAVDGEAEYASWVPTP